MRSQTSLSEPARAGLPVFYTMSVVVDWRLLQAPRAHVFRSGPRQVLYMMRSFSSFRLDMGVRDEEEKEEGEDGRCVEKGTLEEYSMFNDRRWMSTWPLPCIICKMLPLPCWAGFYEQADASGLILRRS